jgi:hypothetical protein
MRQSRIVTSTGRQVLNVFGAPLVIEPWPGDISAAAGLLPVRTETQESHLERAGAAAIGDRATGADTARSPPGHRPSTRGLQGR